MNISDEDPWKKLEDNLEAFKMSGHPFVAAVLCLESLSRAHTLPLYYVGGFLRDLQIGSQPRDIDVMYTVDSKKLIDTLTREYLVKKNRFGGLKLNIAGTPLDMWAVEETPYFSPLMNIMDPPPKDRLPLLPSVINFPLVTFLTVEAIILEVYREKDPVYYRNGDVIRLGWEEGFFHACNTKELELQILSHIQGRNIMNPVPEFDLVRVHTLHSRLGWSIGPRLKEYLRRELPKTSALQIGELHMQQYGFALDAEKIYEDLHRISR